MQERARFEPRLSIGLGGLLSIGNRHLECVTSDVSFSGVSVRVDASGLGHVSSRDLATLKLSLYPSARVIDAPASVVHVTPARNIYAVGLRFYAFAGAARAAWDDFVRGLSAESASGASATALALPTGQHFEPMLYRNAFQVAVLRVYVASVRDLLHLAERNATSMFIVTDEALAVGNEVGLQFVHPNSEDVFEANAFVARVVDQHGVRGVEVEFLDLAFERFDRFREFVEDGIEAWLDDASYAGND